jgi:3',5'-cyclic AMP phosphodiesterase CpdA
MARTLEETLADELDRRLNELDYLFAFHIKYRDLRYHFQNLILVRAYAHLEGGVKAMVNAYLNSQKSEPAHKFRPHYWFWRERGAIRSAVESVDRWSKVAASRAVIEVLKNKTVREIEVYTEYNQMDPKALLEIYRGLGLNDEVVSKYRLLIDDLRRKRNLVSHGNGELSDLSDEQLRKYKDVVELILIDLWSKLSEAQGIGLLRRAP